MKVRLRKDRRDQLLFSIAATLALLFAAFLFRTIYVTNHPNPRPAAAYLKSRGYTHLQLSQIYIGRPDSLSVGLAWQCGRINTLY
ncbi:MAG: hypothetical protein WA843_05120, partial [Candidatus Saccharimonadales bacterium]